MFKPSITFKALVIGVVVLALLIPLSMLRGLVNERAGLRAAAHERVAQSWGGRVRAPGPILIVPGQREVLQGGRPTLETTDVCFLPTELTLAVDIRMQPEPRRVGIYEVPVYLADVRVTGQLTAEAIERWQATQPDYRLQWTAARVLLPLAETRELRSVQASFAGQPLRFVPGGAGELRGIEASLTWQGEPEQPAVFDMHLLLAGSGGFTLLPLGSNTHVKLTADWPHPSFTGSFAPTQYSIDASRFTAEWNVLELNRSYGNAFFAGELPLEQLAASATGVDIFQSIDIYQRGERAIKYALVFIALTFLTFFAWEQVSDVRLHPLQYLLLGLALSVFYLLLIAITEHTSFGLTYAIAATALVALLGSYIAGALRSVARGIKVAIALTATYGFLYGLVLSEDYALLLGAIAVFTALAIVMMVTRSIDWYSR